MKIKIKVTNCFITTSVESSSTKAGMLAYFIYCLHLWFLASSLMLIKLPSIQKRVGKSSSSRSSALLKSLSSAAQPSQCSHWCHLPGIPQQPFPLKGGCEPCAPEGCSRANRAGSCSPHRRSSLSAGGSHIYFSQSSGIA